MSSELRVLRNFINGEFVDAADGATSEVINPSTGDAYATAPVSGAPDLDAAVAIARRNPATRHGSGVEVREIEGAYTRHITSE